MFEGMLAAITKPKPFFEQLTNDDVLVSRAIWVVLLVCVVAAGAGYFSALPLASVMGDNSIIAVTAVLGGTLGLALTTFLGWLITGLLIRMVAGINIKPWAITGYAMSPQLIIYILFIILAAIFPVTLPELGVDMTTDPSGFNEALVEAQALYAESVYARLTQGLSYLSSLWWIALIFLGVDAAAGRNKAFLATAIIALINLGFIAAPWLLESV